MKKGISAILIDLDDTLLVEKQSADDSFLAVAQFLASVHGEVNPSDFAGRVTKRAKELWHSMPTIDYCLAVGISSREGLWAEFTDLNPDQSRLRSLRNEYRFNTWNSVLLEYGINDPGLAERLAVLFVHERSTRHILFPDALPFLDSVAGRYRLALVTNGSPDVQRCKINGGGIGDYFDFIAVSGETGHAKPHSSIFSLTLEKLGASANEAIMIGDRLKNDIAGANAMGITSVLVNRSGEEKKGGARPDYIVSGLAEIDDTINSLNRHSHL